MISYSNQKEVMDLHDLARFLENEQKVQVNLKRFKPLLHVGWEDPPSVCVYFKSDFTSGFHPVNPTTYTFNGHNFFKNIRCIYIQWMALYIL